MLFKDKIIRYILISLISKPNACFVIPEKSIMFLANPGITRPPETESEITIKCLIVSLDGFTYQ